MISLSLIRNEGDNMRIEENTLILDEEVNDEMLEDFIVLVKDEKVENIQIDTDNISSLVMQQIFCLESTKHIVCNDPFMAKFIENISFTHE